MEKHGGVRNSIGDGEREAEPSRPPRLPRPKTLRGSPDPRLRAYLFCSFFPGQSSRKPIRPASLGQSSLVLGHYEGFLHP